MKVTRAALRWALLVGLCLSASATVGADSAPLTQWNPSDSYSDGKLYDARLDRPVNLWGAGTPLRQVFQDLHVQTGVDLAFYPAGDMNERVCITAYLNPSRPPDLRSFLAQLTWVTDCAIMVSGQGEQRTYHLMSTSIGSGIEQRLHEEMLAALALETQQGEELGPKARALLLDRLQELKNYLGMSREEALRQFRGTDDLMLLALANPKRQTEARFLLSLSDRDVEELRSNPTIIRPLSSFSAEQRAWLREGMDLEQLAKVTEALRAAGAQTDAHWDDWDWVEKTDPKVWISTARPTGFRVDLMVATGEEIPRAPGYMVDLPFLELIPDLWTGEPLSLDAILETKELTGETVSKEERKRLADECKQRMQTWERRARVEHHPGWRPELSADTEALLSSTRLPITAEKEYAFWQVQEAVAAESGMNVLSDCFCQPVCSVKPVLDLIYPDGAPDLNALLVLGARAVANTPRLLSRDRLRLPGWEWGDAGTFLRFRSSERDKWRCGFWTAEDLARVDGWLDPSLPADASPDRLAALDVPLDPRACAWTVTHLGKPQLKWGYLPIYGDPTDTRNAYRHAFREKLFNLLSDDMNQGCDLIADLNDDLWNRAQGEGLRWGSDFSPQPTAQALNHHWWPERKQGDLLRVVGLNDELRAAAEQQFGPAQLLIIEITRDGKPIADPMPLIVSLRVTPDGTARLVSR